MKFLDIFPKEADKITRYLIDDSLNEKERGLYREAVNKLNASLDEREKRILALMLKNRFWMGMFDGGLAFLQPNSAIRYRIFIMLSILETSPAYTKHFLLQKHGWMYFIKISFQMVWAVIKASFGIVALQFYR